MGVATRLHRVFIFVATQYVKSIANFESTQIGAVRTEKLRTASKPNQSVNRHGGGGGASNLERMGVKLSTPQTLQSGMGTGHLENFPALIGW